MRKVKSLPALKKIVLELKRRGKRIVFTNGCFDLIHPGHIKIFSAAKKKGDVLIVGINSDSSIKKIKGISRPILKQKAREKILTALASIDYIVAFNEKTPYRLLKALRPHCLIKGRDWGIKQIIGRKLAKKVIRIGLDRRYSTSKIIQRIVKLHDAKKRSS